VFEIFQDNIVSSLCSYRRTFVGYFTVGLHLRCEDTSVIHTILYFVVIVLDLVRSQSTIS